MTKAASIAAACALATAIAARPARAHVQPSVDDNNRYVKVQPLGDRIRVTYTVMFGDVPGASMRPSIDADHDRTISEAEARAFGEKLARDVAESVTLVLDDTARPLAWSEVAVGMGSPQVAAGTFSVDLVAWVCADRGRHALTFHDRFRLPRTGETELKIEDSPGVTIEHARVGATDAPDHDFRFQGPGGPLADDGLALTYVATDRAPVTPDVTCAAAPRGPRWLVALAVGAGLALAAGGTLVVARRRRLRTRAARTRV